MTPFLNRLKKYSPLLGIALFTYIILKIDLKKLPAILATSDIYYIGLCTLVGFLLVPLLAMRWNVILGVLSIKYRFINACISITKGALLGEVTPGRLGEFLRTKYLMADTGASFGKAIFSVVIDRLYDIVILMVLSILSVIILTTTYAVDIPLSYIVLSSVGFILFVTIFVNEKLVRSILSPVFNYLVPAKHQDDARFHFSEFYSGLKSMNNRAHISCIAISTLIWMVKFLMLFLTCKALKIDIHFWLILAIGAMGVMVSLLPISISGLGTREAVFIFFLSFHNIPAEFAVSLSFLFLFFSIISIIILGGVIYLKESLTSVKTPKLDGCKTD